MTAPLAWFADLFLFLIEMILFGFFALSVGTLVYRCLLLPILGAERIQLGVALDDFEMATGPHGDVVPCTLASQVYPGFAQCQLGSPPVVAK